MILAKRVAGAGSQKKAPRTGGLIVLALFLILAASSVAGLQPTAHLVFSFDINGGLLAYVNLSVVEDTMHYAPLFTATPQTGAKTDYSWWLIGGDGKTIHADLVYPGVPNWIQYSPQFKRLDVYRGINKIYSQPLAFCNHDRVCEPCQNQTALGGCAVMENALTCDDCPSGGADGYCDLYNDNRCDPDCGGKDKDCPNCTAPCYYRSYETGRTQCKRDLKGEICDPGINCGFDEGESPMRTFAYAEDSGARCCVAGHCDVDPADRCRSLGGVPCSPFGGKCTGTVAFEEHEVICCLHGGCPSTPPPTEKDTWAPKADDSTAGPFAAGADEPKERSKRVSILIAVLVLEMVVLAGIALIVLRKRKRR